MEESRVPVQEESETKASPEVPSPPDSAANTNQKRNFDTDLIKKYPRSNRKLGLKVHNFGLPANEVTIEDDDEKKNGQSVHISPHGIEFKTSENFDEGALLKIQIALPDYWNRKQKFVDYGRIDNPGEFRVLAKVLASNEVGKRGKKKIVTVQTLVMDEVDEKVLKSYLQEG